MLLKDKVCLVTGAHKGIGLAIAKRFAEEGGIVYANSRKNEGFDDLCLKMNQEVEGVLIPIYFDVTDDKAVREAFIKIKKENSKLDVLVNNAGIMKDALIGMVTSNLMEEVFSVNVYSVINIIQLANKIMSRQENGGCIINMCSIVGMEGNVGQIVYSATKGAVAALTKTAAKELVGKKIRVNAIAPGMIDTDMFRGIGEDKVNEQIKLARMGRAGTPEEVANVALFLASDMSSYMTGEIIGVNGCQIR